MASSDEAVLHYFEGRGRGEMIRLILCAGKFKFRQQYIKTREDFLKLINDGKLCFLEVPMLEMDGDMIVWTNAIVRNIARKASLLGQNEREAARVDSLYEGTRDFIWPFLGYNLGLFGTDEELNATITEKMFPKMLPIFNKILEENKDGYLVGGRLTMADLGLLEVLLATVDYYTASRFGEFPGIQVFYKQMLSLPEIDHYIKNIRHRMNDDVYRKEVFTSLGWE